ncbi:MAG: glycoside hydrolase family 3 protein [Acidobacteria bacterium]|nr:glycoside hydrolase family 3 protein [Acidobacteriota bacterium]
MQSLLEKGGQLFIIGFEGDSWNPTLEKLLLEVRPGGVIFFQRNIASAQSFQRLVRQVRDYLIGLTLPSPFLAIDLEGGTVDRLRDVLAPLPPVREVARAGLAQRAGQVAGRELAAFSLNVDFAPVLDLASSESDLILGSRTAGRSPQEVIEFAADFLDGLAEQGVIGCGKHFPGLGSARVDSHLKMPQIEKGASKMWEQDLLPYRTLASLLPMVMVAHAWYPALEAEHSLAPGTSSQPLPSSLSPALVSGLLKSRIGYSGLVLSDDLEMGGVLENRSVGEAAVAALRAGCDLLLVCRRAEYVHDAFEAVLQEATRDSEFCGLAETAAQKILHAKQALGIVPTHGVTPPVDWEGLRQEINQFTAEVHQRLSTQLVAAKERRS